MAILKDLLIKGDLKVTEDIVIDGDSINKLFGTTIVIDSEGNIILKNEYNEGLGSAKLPE